MPRHGNFAAWMRCNGQCMEEYAVRVDGNVVTAYVASEAGQKFDVIWDVGDECNDSSRAILRMDGQFVRQRLHNHRKGGKEHKFDGVQVDQTSFRPFVFEKISFTDRDDIDMDLLEGGSVNDINEMGTVTVNVDFVHLVQKPSKGFHFNRPPTALTRDVVLPERTKRLGSLRMGISGAVVERQLNHRPSRSRYVSRGNIGDAPAAIFKFICRPRDFLTAEGIIERQEASVPEPSSDMFRSPSRRLFLGELDSNTPDAFPTPSGTPSKTDVKKDIKIRELLQQRSQIRKRESEIQKKLNALVDPPAGTPVKLEDGSSKETAFVVEDIRPEVIDLTMD